MLGKELAARIVGGAAMVFADEVSSVILGLGVGRGGEEDDEGNMKHQVYFEFGGVK